MGSKNINSCGMQGKMTSYFQALTLDGVKLNNRLRVVKERERRKSSCVSPAPNVVMLCVIILINALKININNYFSILCRSNMGSSQNRYITGYTWVWGIPVFLSPTTLFHPAQPMASLLAASSSCIPAVTVWLCCNAAALHEQLLQAVSS